MRRLKMEILELIASTATLHRQVRRSFRAELAVKRRFCSVMPQAFSVWTRARGHFVRYATFYGLGRAEDRLPGGLDLDFLAAPSQRGLSLAYGLAKIFRARGVRVVPMGPHARARLGDFVHHSDLVVTDFDRQAVDDILERHVDPGSVEASVRPLSDLPMVGVRGAQVRAAACVRGAQHRTTVVVLVSSLGCPHACPGVVLARTTALCIEFAELTAVRCALRTRKDMRCYFEGQSRRLSDFLRRRLLGRLGRSAHVLQDDRRRGWTPVEHDEGSRDAA